MASIDFVFENGTILFSYFHFFFAFCCLGFFTFFLPLVPISLPPLLFKYYCYVILLLFSSKHSSF
jgi:hypothetical protein